MVMHSICSISACHSLHTRNPSPPPSASPSCMHPALRACSGAAAPGSARARLGLQCCLAAGVGAWALMGRQLWKSVCVDRAVISTAALLTFFFSRPGPPFCWDFKRYRSNCWEEFPVAEFCWCTSHNRPFMCETSEDTTFVLRFRY